MSFFDFLEKIRGKPRFVRIQILWLCVLLLMAVIFFLWVISLKGSFSSQDQKASIKEELTKPFGEAKNELPSLKKAFKDIIGVIFEQDELKEQIEKAEEIGRQLESLEIKEEKEEEIKPTKLPLR